MEMAAAKAAISSQRLLVEKFCQADVRSQTVASDKCAALVACRATTMSDYNRWKMTQRGLSAIEERNTVVHGACCRRCRRPSTARRRAIESDEAAEALSKTR